mmetsp:Transcript_9189/g.8085  ORF Transcript_9189/g.8085 Transcript_9189/m.8085 type:complete len:125 (+) Transcript_9189:1619-1993(+)
MEIYLIPQYLILHLKRFKTQKSSGFGGFFSSYGSSTKKITSLVDFPLEGLDMSQFVLGPQKENAIYDLYGVSNHFGGMGGGHYTAYCKHHFDGKWYEFDDSSVRKAAPNDVISKAAYVLFYKRR